MIDDGEANVSEDLAQCEILWRFNTIEAPLAEPDVILVLGSNDLHVAEFAAETALANPRALLVCSGGTAHEGDLLKTGWSAAEADIFAQKAISLGVPEARIVRERQATNTAENITRSRALLADMQLSPRRIYLIQKPFMCLRALLTARSVWQGPEFGVGHEDIGFLDYFRRFGSRDLVDIIVGDTARLIQYPRAGYFPAVSIPDEVERSMRNLVRRGYVRHLPAPVDRTGLQK